MGAGGWNPKTISQTRSVGGSFFFFFRLLVPLVGGLARETNGKKTPFLGSNHVPLALASWLGLSIRCILTRYLDLWDPCRAPILRHVLTP